MKEQLLLRFKLSMIEKRSFEVIETIVILGYNKTGNKFWVTFQGSKGYLCLIQIDCEGCQRANNRLFIEKLRNKDHSLQSIMVNVFHSDEKGVRISTGKDVPQTYKKEVLQSVESDGHVIGDDLPY